MGILVSGLWMLNKEISLQSDQKVIIQVCLILSHHPSLLAIALGMSSRQYPICTHSWWIWVFAGQSTLVCPCWSLLENITYKFILTSLAISSITCLSYLNSLRWEESGHIAALLWSAAFRISPKQHTTSLVISYLVFSPGTSLKS